MASSSMENNEGANELDDKDTQGIGLQDCVIFREAMEPMLTDNPNEFLSSAGADQDPLVSVVGNSSGNADSAEMLGFYGEEEVRYDETSSACPNIDPGSAPPKPVETLPPPEGDLVSNEPPKLPDAAPIMGTCEFCGFFGVKEQFFSKSKRFCKVECAKKYSASNIKKRKTDRIASTKKRTVRKPTPSKKIKTDVTLLKPPRIDDVVLVDNWQKKSFMWDEYLKNCNGKAAPAICFRHAQVMSCLKDVHIGMKVEVINNGVETFNNAENTTFWVASVIKFKHFKTLLRYEGYDEDDNADFWFDLRCRDIHPVGWCARINKPLIPPQEIKTRITDWQEYLFRRLSGAKTFSAEFLQKVQEIPHNRFKVGMKVEVVDRKNLYSVMCVATVVDVVGDRLRLRYDGLDPEIAEDFWCHYYSTDIHPVGWSSLVGHQLRPPIGWKNSISEWNKLIEKILAQDRDAPQEIFSEDATGTAQGPYAFEIGMKFEGINPYVPNQICVLTVIKELKYNYFLAGIDSQAAYFCFHANSRNIFPPGWCEAYGIELTPPRDYPKKPFDWDSYCKNTNGRKAPSYLFQPHRADNPFKKGMKLEAVDLREPALVCPATVVDVRGPLLKIHFDGWDVTYDQFLDMDSLDLFPVGYCEITGHPLQPPGPRPDPYTQPGYQYEDPHVKAIPGNNLTTTPSKTNKPLKPEQAMKPKPVKPPLHPESMYFVNRRCCCGPFLNAAKLLKLPDTVKGVLGGSDKNNIARKCLQLLVSASENPKSILELFCHEFYQSKNHVDLDLAATVCIEIKTKNDKRIMRRVKIASKADTIRPNIERACQLLSCCKNVFASVKYPTEQCDGCRLKQTSELDASYTDITQQPLSIPSSKPV